MSITSTNQGRGNQSEDLKEDSQDADERGISPLSEKVASTKLSKTLHDRVQQRASAEGVNISNYLKQLVRDDLMGKRRVPVSQDEDSRELSSFALNRILNAIADMTEEIENCIEEPKAKELSDMKVKAKQFKALSDCILTNLQDQKVPAGFFTGTFQEELSETMNNKAGEEGKKEMQELCSLINAAYGVSGVTPKSFTNVDLKKLADRKVV